MATPSKKKFSKPLQLIILIFSGIIVILVSVILKNETKITAIVCDLLNSIGQSLIIGPALSWILDLPSMIDYFKKITVESLISRDYLFTLDRDKLLQLRKDCTAKIHLKDADFVEKGLINMDENICDLLTKPYYERYRQNTKCSVDGNYLVKKNHIEEVIVNPLSTRLTYKEFPKTFLNIEEGQVVDDVYKIIGLTVRIDGEPEQNFTKKVKLKALSISPNDMEFKTEVKWVDDSGKDLSFDFTKTLVINRTYEIKVPKSDVTFVKRVKMPVKSLKIDYSYSGDDLKLVGGCFGTLSYLDDGGMKILQEEDYISIESFDWLLPGNGVYIVKIPR